ncbi:MAG: chromosomal replication initiator protein [Arenicella sp.]|jgi:chromosomal replication initiator protein
MANSLLHNPNGLLKNNTSQYKHQLVWENCLEIIRQEVPQQSFETWFKPIKALKLNEHVLTIEVPSPFFYEWLEEYYVHILKKAVSKELGVGGKLEYSVIVDKGPANTSQPFTIKVRKNRQDAVEQRAKGKTMQMASLNEPKNNEKYQDIKGQSIKVNPVTSPFNKPEIDPNHTSSQLNPNYTFENYIEGDCNRLARAAGMAIAERPGTTSFNPLVLYSNVGLGKTHLAQSIGNEVKARYPEKFVLYVSSEQFTAQYIEALKANSIQNFTNYYLQIDVLIIDDIQFLARKEKTQEAFFHIFNHLHQSGKQIIMTSDQAPKSLTGLQERLLSRFKWGLTADIQAPSFETRLAIIQTKIQAEGVPVPEDVMEYIAYNVDTNIRELEGVLISLIANSSFMRTAIDMTLAETTLNHLIQYNQKELSVDIIQKIVASYFKLSVDDLKSKTRKKEIAQARQIAMHFCKQLTKTPVKIIGDRFGGRDHSTVVHASKAVVRKTENDSLYQKIVGEIQDELVAKD